MLFRSCDLACGRRRLRHTLFNVAFIEQPLPLQIAELYIIAIDDAHWADRLTRFALRVLPGRLAGSPVTWVLTSRPVPVEVIDEVTAAAEDAITVTRVALGPLAPADIEDLAEDRLGAPPSEAIRELLRGTGGSPFWAVQVLDGLAWRRAHGLTHDDMHAELIDDVRRRLLPLEPDTVSLRPRG